MNDANAAATNYARWLFATLALALVLALTGVADYYSNSPTRTSSAPGVVDLTNSGFKTAVKFGESPQCPRGECFVLPEFDAAGWGQVAVPRVDLKDFPGARAAKRGDWIYYRFPLVIPKKLLEEPREISFTPVYVNHGYYEIYLNGRLVGAGNGDRGTGSTAIVSLPKPDVNSGRALVVIKARYQPGEAGIRSFASLYLGPKEALDHVYLQNEQANYSYYLLLLAAKGGLIVVFALFLLFGGSSVRLQAFLAFATLTFFETLVQSSFLKNLMPLDTRIVLFLLTRSLGAAAAVRFFADALGLELRLKTWLAASLSVTILIGLLAGLQVAGHALVALPGLFKLTDAALASAVGLPALARLARDRRLGTSEGRGMVITALVYAALILAQTLFNRFSGFDKRPVLDLMFFFYVAYQTARNLHSKTNLVERQKVELAKASAARLIADATQMFAHDVRKPYAMMRILMETMHQETDPAAKERLLLSFEADLEVMTKRVDSMIADVMEIGRQRTLRQTNLEPWRIVEAAVKQCSPSGKPQRGKISLTAAQSRKIRGDEDKLVQVFTNLIDNAIEATKSGGDLWFGCADVERNDAPWVEFRIGNSGPAIPIGKLELLFEPFYTEGKRAGTGLGLAIVKRIVEEHQGTVRAESTPERGTEFIVLLPATHATSRYRPTSFDPLFKAPPSVARQRLMPLSPPKLPAEASLSAVQPVVALIDDNPFIRDSWSEALANSGVMVFPSPASFWIAAAQDQDFLERLECVVSDYYFDNQPDTSGEDFAREVKVRKANLRVLVASDGVLDDATCPHADGFISKCPYEFGKMRTEEPARIGL